MAEKYPNEGNSGFDGDRFFVPLVPPYVKPQVLQDIMPFTKWIGFNYIEVIGSRSYPAAQKRGVRDAFGISEEKKIFMTTTGHDEKLERFYSDPSGIEQFRSDIQDFNVDMVMGPDFYAYEDQTPNERKKSIAKALELNERCIDLENVVPNIHGTNFQEIRKFIEPFKMRGRTVFIMPGREYLINLTDRKRSQREFSSLTSTITRSEKIKMIVTGCSSPMLQSNLPDVSGFVGMGWWIQAKYRRLILGNTFTSIFDPRFHCNDFSCCASLDSKQLRRPEKDSIRAVHNLKQIQARLKERPQFSQHSLMGC